MNKSGTYSAFFCVDAIPVVVNVFMMTTHATMKTLAMTRIKKNVKYLCRMVNFSNWFFIFNNIKLSSFTRDSLVQAHL